MGQFKQMVKMETTEPSVILKLKKGGTVAHKKMKADTSSGHKSMKKMADGGMLAALTGAAGNPMIQSAPVVAPRKRIARPSMAARRAAMMMANKGRKGLPMMKKGGEAESAAEHKSEMKKISKVESELKSHEGKKASVAHKGLNKGGACYANGGIIESKSGKSTINTAEHTTKTSGKTGEVKFGNGGGYKTGGVVLGNGGGYKTGGVVLGNGGGFKKGGKASKKAFANGGSVNDAGKAVSMPQGNKPASKPVSINRLSGTFKKGGKVTPAQGRLQGDFARENATAMKQAKAYSNLKYPKKFAKGGYADGGDVMNDSVNPNDYMASQQPVVSRPALGGIFGGLKNDSPMTNIPNKDARGNPVSNRPFAGQGNDMRGGMQTGPNNFNNMYSSNAYAKGGKVKRCADGGSMSDADYNAVMAKETGRKRSPGAITDYEREVVKKVSPKSTRSTKVYPSGLSDSDIDKIINSKEMQEALTYSIDKKRGGKVGK